MKIGFAGRWNPMDKTAWSGTYFYAYQAIKKYYEPGTYFYKWPWQVREYLLLHKQFQKAINKRAAVEFLRAYARYFSRQLEKDLLKRKVDLLFVPGAPQLIAYCNTGIPVIYMTDATFFQLQGYYPLFKNIAAYNINEGVAIDKRAFGKASHCLLTSEWAKKSAIGNYGIEEDKLTVVPLGANMEYIPSTPELQEKDTTTCRLLFLGVEWERKGGQIALDTFYLLQKKGLPVQLTIIGCIPPVEIIDRNIRVISFINKHHPEEEQQLYSIIRNSSFLLLPVRAECAGLAFCEAAAFCVPSISTNTGGVSTYVRQGTNGFLLPVEAGAEDYADCIQSLFQNEPAYRNLCINSRKYYEEKLNWDNWGRTFSTIAEKWRYS